MQSHPMLEHSLPISGLQPVSEHQRSPREQAHGGNLSVDREMDKEGVEHIYYGILACHKKE